MTQSYRRTRFLKWASGVSQLVDMVAAHLFLPVLDQLGQAEGCGHAHTSDHHRPLQHLPERHHQLWIGEVQRGVERVERRAKRKESSKEEQRGAERGAEGSKEEQRRAKREEQREEQR